MSPVTDDLDAGHARDGNAEQDARTLYCLLASYEVYGLSHGWPRCLGGPCVLEVRS